MLCKYSLVDWMGLFNRIESGGSWSSWGSQVSAEKVSLKWSQVKTYGQCWHWPKGMEAKEGSLCQLAVEPTRKLFWLPLSPNLYHHDNNALIINSVQWLCFQNRMQRITIKMKLFIYLKILHKLTYSIHLRIIKAYPKNCEASRGDTPHPYLTSCQFIPRPIFTVCPLGP